MAAHQTSTNFKDRMYQELKLKVGDRKNSIISKLNTDLQQPCKINKKMKLKADQDTEKDPVKKIKGKRTDPLRKIFQVNQQVIHFKTMQNKKLMRILERVELDKPILMHDKLDVIWDF